jgi:hypothetical protein
VAHRGNERLEAAEQGDLDLQLGERRGAGVEHGARQGGCGNCGGALQKVQLAQPPPQALALAAERL